MGSFSIFRLILVVATLFGVSQVIGSRAVHAATVTQDFAFFASDNSVVSSGSFSYDSSAIGTLSFNNLTAFNFFYPALGSTTFTLSDVNSLSDDPYIYFRYDIASNTFVPGVVSGYAGDQSGLLAATDGISGFFVDPLPGMADPAGTGANGAIVGYSIDIPPDGLVITNAATYSISESVSAIPEPSTWALMIVGFLGLGALIKRKQRIESITSA